MKEEPIHSKYIISNENYMSKIKNMLIAILKQLNSNNIIKSSLINLKDFNQKEFFDQFDNLQKGYLNSVDIVKFLKKFSLNFSEQLIRRFIQHYDKKTPYKLYFEDFKNLITPKNSLEEENKNNIKGNRDEFFLKVLKNEFKLIVKYHEMIVDIKKCENFITYEAFISISDEEKNITNDKLKKFLGTEFNDDDIKNLLYYLDMDNDGLLTYDEFEDFFASMPVSQDDINYMNNEEIKYASIIEEKNESQLYIKKQRKDNELNNQIIKKEKEENINILNNQVNQNKIIYDQNISKTSQVTEVKTKEIKYLIEKNIINNNINNGINNYNMLNENEYNDLSDNKENENLENIEKISYIRNNNKIVKKINYNNKNLLKNNKEIIEYEEGMKNRYSSTDENIDNNDLFNKNNEQIKKYNIEKKENNLLKKNEFEVISKDRNKNIINTKEIKNQEIKEININNNKKYKVEIKSNIINKELNSNNSQNDENKNDDIKENNLNENNQFSSSYKVIDNSNNKEIIENINIKDNKNINNNNTNDYNHLLSSNNFSGNISSTDFNKSDNFISENNINNNLQKNNEMEYEIQNKNEYDIEYNNNQKKNKDLNNQLNIERENLEYIQNKIENNSSDNIKEEDLYIQKNTNLEIKNEINLNEQNKDKYTSKIEFKKEENNLLNINNKNEKVNKMEINNNSFNQNNSDNSHANNINVNGSLFTCGGNAEQEKITLKPVVQEIENEDNKNKINSIQTNNDLVTQIKSEYKSESPFSNINKNLNDVFSKEIFMNKNNKEKDYEIFNSNNKYFYFQDRLQNEEEEEKINTSSNNKNENIYINKVNKEKKKNNIIKNLNMNKVFKEQIHEEREDYLGELSEIKYKFSNEKYIIENNMLKKNLKVINNFKNNNIFSNDKIEQKSETSENDDYNPNNEQTIHDLSHVIDINSNEYNFTSKTSINIFLDYIDNILKLECVSLSLKESLALREDITFKELFCLFDYHKNKNISIREYKKVCKNSFGLYPTTDQVTLVFNRYDINKDEKLDLKEFLNMISPIKKEYLSILFGDKRIQKPFRTELSEKSKKNIENLTKTIILNETNYYEIKEKMRINNFNKNEVWNNLLQFSKNKNYLNKKNFDRFLKAHSYYLTSYEIEIIFNKFDFDKDSHLSLNDFIHEFNF